MHQLRLVTFTAQAIFGLSASITSRCIEQVKNGLLTGCFLFATLSAQAVTLYVKANASGANNGNDWENAFTNLQSALTLANANPNITEIWVAAGTYKPTAAVSGIGGPGIAAREVTFQLREGIKVYGGFNGTEMLRSERNPAAHLTTLSGDVGTVNDASDNAYHVVYVTNVTNATVLDGFTIVAGNANAAYSYGGGMLVISGSPVINNCIFIKNNAASGGGIAIINGGPSVTNSVFQENSANAGGGIINSGASSINTMYENCVFSKNTSTYYGGALACFSTNFTAIKCVFSENSASPAGGGAVYTEAVRNTYIDCGFFGNAASGRGGAVSLIAGVHTFMNCVVSGNSSGSKGGGLYIEQSSDVNIANCTVSGNIANEGGGIVIGEDASNKITNTIVWNNQDASGVGTPGSSVVTYEGSTTITYSLIQGQNPAGTGNKDGTLPANDPDFLIPVNPATAPTTAGDLRVGDCSLSIDAGNDADNSRTIDFAGNTRKVDALPGGQTIDLGAYERQSIVPEPTVVCRNQTVQLNAGGAGSLTMNSLYNSSSGCDPLVTPALTTTLYYTCSNIGTNPVVFTVTDIHGRSTTCQASVTVAEVQPPAITCPANIIRNNDAGLCSAVVTYANPTATDNCTVMGFDHLNGGTSGSTFPVGTTTVIWQATDMSNNTTTCSFNITVNDTQAPTITCPASQTRNTDNNACTAVATYANPTVLDNCTANPSVAYRFSGATTTAAYAAGTGSGATFNKGITTITLRATDGVGLTRTCTFRVIVTDGQAPSFSVCPPNQSVGTTPTSCTSAAVTYATPTAADNCAPAPVVVRTGGPASGATFPVGTTQVIWRATDGASRTATCAFSVTVTDNTPPLITCPNDITVSGSGIPCQTTAFYAVPTATDNCEVQNLFLQSGLASGSSFSAGVTVNVWRATDARGTTATCSISVTVTCSGNRPGHEVGQGQTGQTLPQGWGLTLSPNPANTEVLLSVCSSPTAEKTEEGHILIYDALGRLLHQQVLAESRQTLRLDVSDWPAGMYWVAMQWEGQMVAKKLVKNN